mgnify:CR=1 FL=1
MKNVITTLLFISFIFISQYQGYGQNDIKLLLRINKEN